MEKQEFVEMLVESWQSPVVARSATAQFTGNAVSGRTVANREALGDKVPGRAQLGKRIIYPTRSYAEYLADRFLKIEKRSRAMRER